MKMYFSRITADHWTAKNKLEKAAHELAKEMDRRLITENEVLDFKAEFLDKIKRLNQQFNRCKPLHLSFVVSSSHIPDHDYWIYCDGVFHMSLFLVKDKN